MPIGDETPVGETIILPGSEEDVLESFDWMAWSHDEAIEVIKDAYDPDFEYSKQQRWAQRRLEELDVDVPREGKWGWAEFWLKMTLYSFAYSKGAKMHLSSPEIQRYEESALSQRGAGGGGVVI